MQPAPANSVPDLYHVATRRGEPLSVGAERYLVDLVLVLDVADEHLAALVARWAVAGLSL